MNRDPAFLFYDGDAARDVSHLNRLERGCYFDLIQAQVKFHGISTGQAKKILGKDFESCWPAIEMVLLKEDDKYFIEWLKISVEKRKAYTEKQRERSQNYWDKQRESRGNPVGIPHENENENENINRDKNINVNEIINDLNLVLGTDYKPTTAKTRELISARLKEGFTVEDFKAVHRKMLKSWGVDRKMCKFLRPQTLYSPKFEGYLQQKEASTALTETGINAYLVGQNWLRKQKEAENVE